MSSTMKAPKDNDLYFSPIAIGDYEGIFENPQIEDAPEVFDEDSFFRGYEAIKKKNQLPTISLPENPYVSITKSNMLDIINISGMILEKKLLSKGGKLNFLEFEVIDSNIAYVCFCNQNNYLKIKLDVSSKGMDAERIIFFNGDLKTYVYYCQDESFVIQKDIVKNKYMVNLFKKYVYAKVGSTTDGERRDEAFSDPYQYEHKCSLDATLMYKFLLPLASVTYKKSKTEEYKYDNRVNLYNNYAIVIDENMSFLILPCPDGTELPNCAIAGSFINILSAITHDKCKGTIEIGISTENRLRVKTTDYEASGVLYTSLGSDIYLGYLHSLRYERYINIDERMLRHIASYSCNARLSKKQLAFNYDSNGFVKCTILHEDDGKAFNYIIVLNSEHQSLYEPLECPTVISALSLNRLLKAYAFDENKNMNSKLGIIIQDEQVVLKSGDIYTVLKKVNIMT